MKVRGGEISTGTMGNFQPELTIAPEFCSRRLLGTWMKNKKCQESPQFPPHSRNTLLLTQVNSVRSPWHSCLLQFLHGHRTLKS
jgi:hypothetical protein